jgi:hypothetical protein
MENVKKKLAFYILYVPNKYRTKCYHYAEVICSMSLGGYDIQAGGLLI